MKVFVRKRYASAKQQLENPGPRPGIVRRPPGGPPGGLPPRIAGRIQQIQRRVREMQQSGQDMSPIHGLLQRVCALLQQGRFAEAEKIIHEVLELVGETPSKRGKDSPRNPADGR